MNTGTLHASAQVPPVHPRAANRGWLARARSAGLAGGALLSFLALSLYASSDGEVMVSQTRLAGDVGLTDRTIRNHIRRWQRAGLLDGRTRVGPRGLTLYRLAAPDLGAAGVGPGRSLVALEGRPGAARVAPEGPESLRRAAGAPEGSRLEAPRYPDRKGLVPTQTLGGRESASDLSPAVVTFHHPRGAWPRSPRPLEPSRPVVQVAPRAPGAAYAPHGEAHPAAAPKAPARALHGPAQGSSSPAALAVLRGALADLRARAIGTARPLEEPRRSPESGTLEEPPAERAGALEEPRRSPESGTLEEPPAERAGALAAALARAWRPE